MRFAVIAWLVQPLYIAVELLVAARVTAPYSIMDNTISDLGATTCGTVGYPFGAVPVCSPWHDLLNISFVVFGALLAAIGIGVLSLLAGAVFLARTGSPDLGGFLERLALWPAYLLLPVLALRLAGRRQGQ